MITSSNTSSAPVLSARLRNSSRNPGAGGTTPMLAGTGSARIAANSWRSVASITRLAVVPGDDHRRRRGRLRDAGARGNALCGEPRAGLGEQSVDVAVVGARELQDLLAAGDRARQPDRAHRRLGARRGHPQHLTDGIRRATSSASWTSASVGAPKLVPRAAAAAAASTTAGLAWPRISGPHEQTQSTYSLPSTSRDQRAAARRDEDRVASDRAHRAHRRVDSAREQRQARRRVRGLSERLTRRRACVPSPGSPR